MNKKKLGFSLAELLISLLIISIVLSAAIPTITKKNGASRENIWHWSDQNNSVYSALGDNQSVLVGVDRLITLNIDDVLRDKSYSGEDWNISDIKRIPISNKGDKLSILKKQAYSTESDFANSHISFYNTYIDGTAPVFKYAGRLTMDPGNIAIGIGSLQNQNGNAQEVQGENTAIGHLSLTQNESGFRNTAVGRKTLTKNIEGSNNTAVGFAALYTMGTERARNNDGTLIDGKTIPEANTAIGSLAQRYLLNGKNNTSLGYASSYRNLTGNDNTALGFYSLPSNNSGDRNTAVGAYSCGLVKGGHYDPDGSTFGHSNICLGYQSGINGYFVDSIPVNNYGLYIGTPIIDTTTGMADASKQQPAIITGHTEKEYIKGSDSKDHLLDKELMVNARKVVFSPYDGSSNTFEFISNAGPFVLDPSHPGKNIPLTQCLATNGTACTDGYSTSSGVPRFGIASFYLRDTGGAIPNSGNVDHASIKMTFDAPYATNMAYIKSGDFDYSKGTASVLNPPNKDFPLSDINFNNALTFDFPKKIKFLNGEVDASSNYRVAIRAERPFIPASSTSSAIPRAKFPLLLNDVIEITSPVTANSSGVETIGENDNSSISFNFPVDGKLRFDFRAVQHSGSNAGKILASTDAKAPNSYFEFNNRKFDVVLTNQYLTQPTPSNPNPPPPGAEFFTISSDNGLTYNTEKAINIWSTGSYANIHFGGEASPNPTTNDATLHISNEDLYIKKIKDNSDIADPQALGAGLNGSVSQAIIQAGKRIKQLDAKITDVANGISSDIRLKNISGDSTAGLKEINAIEVKNFTYKDDKEKTPHVGVIAQQLQKIFPNSVSKDDKGYLRIKTEEIFYAMVNSIKELCKQIQDLTAKVTGLDKRITELEKQNKMLQEQNKAFEKRLQKLEKQSAKK